MTQETNLEQGILYKKTALILQKYDEKGRGDNC